MTRIVVVDPHPISKADDILEFELDGRHRAILVDLLEIAGQVGHGLEWIEVGEGSLMDRILQRGTGHRPAAPKAAKATASVEATFPIRRATRSDKGKARVKAKHPTSKNRKRCPHCGELFARRGIGPHIAFAHTNPEHHASRMRALAKARALARREEGGLPPAPPTPPVQA